MLSASRADGDRRSGVHTGSQTTWTSAVCTPSRARRRSGNGGQSPIWHPQWALEAFWNFELPRDIVEERGYPQLTDQAKRKILGENLARLHGIDVEAKKTELGVPG
jgi:hypothetical protein